MLGFNEQTNVELRAKARGVARLGTICGALAILVMITGCPPVVVTPTACTADDAATVCDDNINCTTDACTDDVCVNTDVACDDGEACDEASGACVATCVDDADCDDGDACTDDACTEGVCGTTATVCDDGDACTDDTCDSATGCVTAVTDCDDGDACTDDSCDPDAGCANVAISCADGESCDATTGLCAATCTDPADCADDADACTDATCTDGVCGTTATDCDDGDLCTTDTCDADTGCANDAVVCDTGFVCEAATGDCVSGGDPCTVDADCADDGLFCTGAETCVDLFCASAGDPCTAPATCNEDLNQCDTPLGDIIPFTLATDNLAGTGLDDTFSALLAFNAPTGTNVPSLQTGDVANGGDGDDVLNAQFNFAATTTVAPTLTAIETINITDFGTAVTTLAGTGITGATSFNLINSTNTNPFSIPTLASLANVGVTNQAVGVTLAFATAATSGTTDAMTLTLNGMTAFNLATCTGNGAPLACCTGNGAGTCGWVTLTTGTTNGVETLNIVSNTNASTVPNISMNGTTLTTVNISGDAKFTHSTTFPASVTSVSATGASGGVNVTQTNANAFTFAGGAGDDTIILGATYGTTDTINGGTGGSDTLGGTAAVLGGTTVIQTKVTNMDKLRVSNALNTSIDLAHFGSITGVTLDLGSNGGAIINGANGLTLDQGLSGAGGAVGGGALDVTIAGSSSGDSVTWTLSDAEQVGISTFTGTETLNIVSNLNLNGSAAAVGTGGQNTLTAALILVPSPGGVARVVVTGTEQLNLAAAVTAKQLDASGFTQPLIMAARMVTVGVSVTGGSAADTLFGSTGLDAFAGGGGADTFSFATGDIDATPSATAFDTIADFETASDIFVETSGALVIMPSATAAASGVALINAEGIASFHSADTTLALRIVATEAGINLGGTAAVRQFCVFEHGGNSYLFISNGVDGLTAADMLFEMTGVTGLVNTTLTGGALTIN